MSWFEPFMGFAGLAHPAVLLAVAVGALTGVVIGVLPGIGPGVAIAVMLPLTYGMNPLAGITLLLGIYVGAYYGGAVTSILIRTPGEASSIMTMFDGAPMAERGEAERALSLAFASAFVGGIVSALVLAFVAAPVSQFTSRFGAAENFMAALLAMIFIARAYERQIGGAVMMIGLGLLIGTVGIDPTSNEQRFTFGLTALQTGLPLVPVVIGLFGVAQAHRLQHRAHRVRKRSVHDEGLLPAQVHRLHELVHEGQVHGQPRAELRFVQCLERGGRQLRDDAPGLQGRRVEDHVGLEVADPVCGLLDVLKVHLHTFDPVVAAQLGREQQGQVLAAVHLGEIAPGEDDLAELLALHQQVEHQAGEVADADHEKGLGHGCFLSEKFLRCHRQVRTMSSALR